VAAGSPEPGSVSYSVDAYTNLASANAFYGLVSGNDSKGINSLPLPWGGGWTLAAKDNTDSSDDESTSVLGIHFAVDAGAKSPSGQWTLTGTGMTTGSLLLDIVAVLKSSTEYGLYYFHDIAFDGLGGGSWLSPSLNNNGQRQDLSHLSIYVRAGTDTGASIPSSGGFSDPTGGLVSGPMGGLSDVSGGGLISSPQSTPTPTPEPGSLALVAAALAALAAIRRKAALRGA
jgi:MYXO-CTERM domain-containing protein